MTRYRAFDCGDHWVLAASLDGSPWRVVTRGGSEAEALDQLGHRWDTV